MKREGGEFSENEEGMGTCFGTDMAVWSMEAGGAMKVGVALGRSTRTTEAAGAPTTTAMGVPHT